MTGLSKAFIIDENKKNELIKNDPSCQKLIKPFLEGSDVIPYGINWKKKYIIFTRRGIDIEQFPSIKRHLLQFKEELTPKKNKDDKGAGRRPGNFKWYEPIDPVSYYKEFEEPKIIYGSFSVKPRFTIDYEGYFANNANFIIPLKEKKLIGILNSKIGWFFIKNHCTRIRGGYQLIGDYMTNIPISKKESSQLETLVEKIMSLTKKSISKNKIEADRSHDEMKKIEKEIDQLVYQLYELSDEEIKIVES
jgi:hypothetical protein